MLTTSCPSCASPLTFRSGAALSAVCDACQTVVVREGDIVRDYGKIARFQRDLSPIRVDARGKVGARSFRVAGVIRKARDRVRWNEWYVVFDDGGDGWIGEGNGEWSVYTEQAPVSRYLAEDLGADDLFDAGGAEWRVTEASAAAIVAAEGQLPFAFHPGDRTAYFDAREVGGARVATLDFADDPPVLWVGRGVTLPQLQMEGLRPFAGWSDPALVHFEGPEIRDVRALRCDACGASNAVRAPGQTQHLACAYCGSVLAVDAGEERVATELLERREKAPFTPRIPLGTRGKLDGVEWQAIGAMVRSTWADGQEWSWTEYALFNPYRGFAWLVHDSQNHWSFVEPVRGALPTGDERLRTWRGKSFRRFQRGNARVKHVLGEFTWEVAVGDEAYTADYVAPPNMLSLERTDDELTWSVGTWQPVEKIAAAFDVKLAPSDGVAPHEPNPHYDTKRVASITARGVALFAVALVLTFVAAVLPSKTPILAHDFLVTEGANAWVTDPVRLDEEAIVSVQVDARDLPSEPDVQLSFIHAETGEVWDWTTYGMKSARARLPAGTWSGRVAIPTDAPRSDAGKSLKVAVDEDPGWGLPAVLLLLYTFLAPIAWFVDATSFEQRRWANADPG